MRGLGFEALSRRTHGAGPITYSPCHQPPSMVEVHTAVLLTDSLVKTASGAKSRRSRLSTIAEAVTFFSEDKKVTTRLEPFVRVGLGYLTLGQPLSTLSGGEHQRVRLALALTESAAGRLFVFDEPTTGLHAADIQVLLRCLTELIEDGGSVLVVEHNLDLIRRADWIIDIGPEGGPGGGRVVAEGTPADLSQCLESHTGQALQA